MDKYELRLSCFLSRILRHEPEIVGITIDKYGWADVKKLLQGMREKGRTIDEELLEKIVREDNKQRYSFNENHTKIRANQGHSIPVEVEMTQATPPDVLYHGTATRFLSNIMTQGILPMSRLFVHLSGDVETAMAVGARHGNPVVLTIDTVKMREDGYLFYLSENHVWNIGKVPPQYFSKTDPIYR